MMSHYSIEGLVTLQEDLHNETQRLEIQSTDETNSAETINEPIYLNLREICNRLDVTYAFLRRYVEADGMAEILGAERISGQRGMQYPVEALSILQKVVEANRQD